MKRALVALAAACGLVTAAVASAATKLPPDFVYLSQVAPSIEQDIRYAGYHNFVGHPIPGYDAPQCILTQQAATALAKVQAELEASELGLKVYDCYRPKRAVTAFIVWSRDSSDQSMKDEFYPRVDKAQVFALGYVAKRSGHSRGSTVDVTIVRPGSASVTYQPGDPLHSCIAPYVHRFHDGTLNMGTSFDCMDELSHPDADVGDFAEAHRGILRHLMEKYGFTPVREEWWHFTLAHEPFPNSYFDFPIENP
jgi:zinc D-Ala-D-Ala dipeptidase